MSRHPNQGKVSDEQIIDIWRELKSPSLVARKVGLSLRAIQARRNKIEEERKIVLPVADHRPAYARGEIDHGNAVYTMCIQDGTVLVASDIHIWPDMRTTMQRAFLHLVDKWKPNAVILNGDVFDGASISRHPPIGWEHRPSVKRELDAVKDFLGDLTKVVGNAQRIWTCGNHDARFSTRLAAMVPEYAEVQGMQLKDHFEQWTPCWRVDVNDDIVVKHRMAGGEHADWNNVVRGGKTTVTGHDHRLNVTPYRDYRGLRWGVRCGYMGQSQLDPQFVNYLEAGEPNWEPGFVRLNFRNGRLLWPEVVSQFEADTVQFRGELITV